MAKRQGRAVFRLGAISGIIFTLADKKATLRQIYHIAELDKPRGEPTRSPKFMRLLVLEGQPRIESGDVDICEEIVTQIIDKSDPVPKRSLDFRIEVTDEGSARDILGLVRRRFKNWRRIGTITFNSAVASYNGNFVLRFHRPGWRHDPNNPATANRKPIS